MRVLMVLLALVAMPLMAGVAQESAQRDRDTDENHGVRHAWARGHDKNNRCDNDERSDARRADRKDVDHDGQCAAPVDPPPPPSTPPPSPTPPPSACTPPTQAPGGVTIKVIVDSGFIVGPPMACVTVTASNGIATVTGVTDGTGTFTFTGLAPNTYTICEVVPSGWVQSWPNAFFFSCGLGVWGYQFAVNAAATVNFSNTHP